MSGLRFLVLTLLVLVVSGCERFNSEMKVPKLGNGAQDKPKSDNKQQCDFNLEDNCWVQSLSFIADCMNDSLAGGFDKFYDNRALCGNDKGRLVEFNSPQGLELSQKKSYNGYLDFTVYSKGNTCFRLEGRLNNFSVRTDLGEIVYLATTDGVVNIKCLDGKYLQVSKNRLQSHCGLSPEQAEKMLPKISFQHGNLGTGEGWSFFFFGNTNQPLQSFRCQL